ncbi:NmrA family NAD(P)-binding protein [Burkholderia pseudomallei]|uniref:NmrA family NAD(P)-binding protein n=1 Tax=Burkholderia pseudomallei TaxID=28450 RepID=UPI00293296F0|nr:NmrA family NAD(P)-binding protein [Burkholderia pseudomallei]MDV2119485.1 NmrA family NAD(P)-binding protein [Burkholderia pseudomallei]MDV2155179.1 NmrA family NAD(P)-binding protein [Burkholderia pseudomallei]
MSKKVLITGATGDTGRAAVREAIALGLNVRAMVRKTDERSAAIVAQGAEVVVGDLFDINSVRSALEGVDAAYFVYPVAPGLITAAVNFAQAAKEAGTKAVINLSQRSADRHSTSDSCRDTFIAEEVFNWSGVPVIHLRPTLFLEWLLYPFQLPYLQHGLLRLPAGKGRHSPVATDDQGRAIAALLQNPEGHIGTTINLSGPVEMDHEQMAAELSDALGRKIVFQDLPIEEYTASLTEMGVPDYVVQHFGGAMLDYQNGHMAGADNNVEMLTGLRSMTVGEFAKLHADKLNAS